MKQLILGIVIVIVFAFIGGFTWNYISGLKADIVSLTTTVNDLTVTVEQKNSEIDVLTGQKTQLSNELAVSNAKAASYAVQVSTLESKVAGYVAQVAGLQMQVSNLQTNVTSLQSEKTALNTRLTNVLKTTVIQHYDWLNTYTWELSIPLSLYIEYKERPRAKLISSWVDMAKDPKDDSLIDQMVQFINTTAKKYSFTEQQKVSFVTTFIQGLPYTVDSVTTGSDEYPRYPIETLFDRGGDCEDTSILATAILDAMGYDVALLDLVDAEHMAVGIALANTYGWSYTYNGKKYYYLETTGEGWGVGQMPSEYTTKSAHVYTLR